MKLRLLALSLFISLISCSGDDSSEPVNENPNPENPTVPVDKVVIQIERIQHQDYPYKREIIQYENGKPVSGIAYDENNNILTTSTLTYNDEGYMVYSEVIEADGSLNNSSEYFYDEEGRLSNYIHDASQFNMMTTRDYVYNNDNTVTLTRTDSGSSAPAYITFYLNENNKIYKIKNEVNNDDNSRHVAEFNGVENINSVTTLSDYGVYHIANFNYDYSHEIKGEYLNRYNLFGNFNNAILRGESFMIDYPAANYLTSYVIQNGEDNLNVYENHINYDYEFDEYGYPINVERYLNGQLLDEDIITYE